MFVFTFAYFLPQDNYPWLQHPHLWSTSSQYSQYSVCLHYHRNLQPRLGAHLGNSMPHQNVLKLHIRNGPLTIYEGLAEDIFKMGTVFLRIPSVKYFPIGRPPKFAFPWACGADQRFCFGMEKHEFSTISILQFFLFLTRLTHRLPRAIGKLSEIFCTLSTVPYLTLTKLEYCHT